MDKLYYNIHISVPEEDFEILIGFLSNYPTSGIEEKMDELIVTIPSIFWNETMNKMMEEDVTKTNKDAKITEVEEIFDKNWNEEWEKTIAPIIIDDEIAITPEWEAAELTQKHKIIINPKMSFGTGHHATTRMMCKLLKKNVIEDSQWIDAGSGTGVLAILTMKLGAKNVFAFDNDEWSIENAKENFVLNYVVDVIEMQHIGIEAVNLPKADGIAANMYTHLLKPNMKKFYDTLSESNGHLIVSGILIYDKEDIIKAGESVGFTHIETIQEDEWIAIDFKIK